MSSNYFKAGVRVVVLFALAMALTVLARPGKVFASPPNPSCTDCVASCERDYFACFRYCRSIYGGLYDCEDFCNPTQETCEQQCTDQGLCP